MYHFLPYIVGMGIAWFQFAHQRPELGSLAQSSMAQRTYATTLIAFTCAFLLGTYLHIQMIGVMGGVLANPPIYGADTLVPHVGSILTSWLYLGGYPIGGPLSTSAMRVAQLSPLGLYFTARIVLALAILVLPFAFVRQAIVHKQRAGRMPIVAWVPIIALLLAGFFHLTSFRYPRPDDYTSIRYLVVPLLLVGVASGALASHAIERALGKPWNAAMLAGAAVFLGFMNNVFPATRYAPPLMPLAGKNPNLAIVECLQRHGFQYGYGGFWSSNALTVLSDSAVKVRPVSISARSIDMFPAHTADNWYDPAAWLGTSFLLLSDSEYRTVERSWLLGRLGEGERTIQCGSFTAIGYGYNIARRLFGNIEKSIDIDIGESTPHQIGRFISQNEMRSLAGETGYLLFGPYLSVKKGRYEARLTIRNLTSGDGDGDVGIMDVVAAKGEKTLAKTELSTGHLAGELKLPFILDFDARDVEIRVYSNGRAALAVSGPIEVRNAASSAVGPQ